MGKQFISNYRPKALADRLENEKDKRPVLREHKGDDLVAFIADKLAERDKFYGQAAVIANGVGLTAEKAAHLLNK